MGQIGKGEVWLALLFLAIFSFALRHYVQPVWVQDADAKVANALELSYAGSRFDQFEVSVEQCEIRMYRKDTKACENGSTLQAFSTYIDLRHHEAEIGDISKSDGDTWSIFVNWKPVGEWETQTEEIKKEAEAHLQSARTKYGRGQAAAIAASENLSQSYDTSDFHSLGTTEYCPAGLSVGPFTRAYKLVGRDAKELKQSIQALMNECRAR